MIDFSKPVQTTDGRAARIICTDAKGDYPVVALVGENSGETKREEPQSYTQSGSYLNEKEPSSNDLVNIPETRTVWVNVYPSGNGTVHSSQESAEKHSHSHVTKRLRVEYIV